MKYRAPNQPRFILWDEMGRADRENILRAAGYSQQERRKLRDLRWADIPAADQDRIFQPHICVS